MSDKKHIDRVFQEKLKDFEMTPDPKVWKEIQNRLENEKEVNQKQYPFWFRLAGIAAALILLLTIGSLVFNSLNTTTETKTVDSENKSSIPSNTNSNDLRNVVDTNSNSTSETQSDEVSKNELNSTHLNTYSTITDSSNDSNEINNKTLENNSSGDKSIITIPNSSLANTSPSNNTSSDLNDIETSNTSTHLNNKKESVANNSTVDNNNADKTSPSNNEALRHNKTPITQSNGIANSDKNLNHSQTNLDINNTTNTSKAIQNQDAIVSSSDSNKTSPVKEDANNTSNTSTINNKSANLNSNTKTGLTLNSDKTTPVKEDANNISITPTINNKSANTNSNNETGLATYQDRNKKQSNENETLSPELDYNKVDEHIDAIKESTGLVSREDDQPNNDEITKEETTEKEKDTISIEEAIALAENIIEEEEKVNRWQVYTNVAPVYYNTLGKGSHIHEEFVNNPKSGELNTSYGVNVGYALNEKLTVRTGFHSLNLSYDTDNAILYENVSTTTTTNSLRNINLAPTVGGGSTTLSVLSADNVSSQQLSALGANFNAAISQRISYFEVPLELQYRIVNNRFGVNITGGVSTFILDDNEVYSEFEDRKTLIGEANNITSVSFSGNLGLGIDYKFTEKLKFNLEPTFKYQLNAYKETSGDFRPYIIGVYTGLSYKF